MANVLITGASGFIGSAFCAELSYQHNVFGVSRRDRNLDSPGNLVHEQADILNLDSIYTICEKHSPDVVIHCAGLAHQKIGNTDFCTYMRVNSEATENLAKEASKSKSDVCFIFLSSVSVYGEENLHTPVSEDDICKPSGDYAESKLDAERRLLTLYDRGIIHNLIILRLAPVYDHDWSFNLNRRVLAPFNIAYFRFGTGLQKMSALARPNLVEFISFLLNGSMNSPGVHIFNVCDAEHYAFDTIIQIFKESGLYPKRPVLPIPLSTVRIATHGAGSILSARRRWLRSCYDKLASDLIFDNRRMLKTGFRPRHSLKTIYKSESGLLDLS